MSQHTCSLCRSCVRHCLSACGKNCALKGLARGARNIISTKTIFYFCLAYTLIIIAASFLSCSEDLAEKNFAMCLNWSCNENIQIQVFHFIIINVSKFIRFIQEEFLPFFLSTKDNLFYFLFNCKQLKKSVFKKQLGRSSPRRYE